MFRFGLLYLRHLTGEHCRVALVPVRGYARSRGRERLTVRAVLMNIVGERLGAVLLEPMQLAPCGLDLRMLLRVARTERHQPGRGLNDRLFETVNDGIEGGRACAKVFQARARYRELDPLFVEPLLHLREMRDIRSIESRQLVSVAGVEFSVDVLGFCQLRVAFFKLLF